MAFHWNLSDSKSPQFSRTLLRILDNLNNTVVWIVATLPLISKSSYPCTNLLVTVPRAPITIGIIVTFMFHSFFNFLESSFRFYFLKVFYISVSWSFFTGVWVTASLIKSPGLFSVFWSISAMLSFGLFPPAPLFPSPTLLILLLSLLLVVIVVVEVT